MENKKYLLFSDLDGTLLDHNSYDFSDANEALKLLQLKKIPLILATSKTFAEVLEIQKKLGIKQPFIVENGAGIFLPKDCEVLNGISSTKEWVKISKAKSYTELRKFFETLQEQYPLRGFGDMDVTEVMELTGLNHLDASNAMSRNYSEPFLFENEAELETLQMKANRKGFAIVKGGRFYHLISRGIDKGSAVKQLTKIYEDFYECKCHTIALGDSANDFSMLRSVKTGVLIPLYDGSFAPLESSKIQRASYPGPKGWNSFIMEFFNAH
ncbi:MAG: HAD-IIB family hydrolase [Campylobacterales bacterium]|nr:HAD-IIB family hydrolase [Campylobacterales bacterium]